MALRGFQQGGVHWQVWSVIPGTRKDGERRRGRDRRSPDPVFLSRGPDRRKAADRRSVAVSAAFAAGWLVFQAPHERRRLAPIPADWETLSSDDLARLCERATPVHGLSDG
ncbi:hypothetical protein [Longimicrobium sp.]|jgi:hypothetical protein|uniref:hypothetical protein n=1 Tax=Longimicrobium sp. TaxID=2029185 RepID=UPI002ED8C219